MPELPEVETICRDLRRALRGATILDVSSPSDRRFVDVQLAAGRCIRSIKRRGKYLLFGLGDLEMVVHLGMSGRLFAADVRRESYLHERASVKLDSDRRLVLVDRRRFGTMRVVKRGDYRLIPTLHTIGPEPLSAAFDPEAFASRVVNIVRPIKAALLEQRLVAGLGNIYADETLFRAGIHPARQRISRLEALRLHESIQTVLREAVRRRGTSFSLYRDGLLREGDYLTQLRVFGRAGQPCRECGEAIRKTRLGGRGTHFCPSCQRSE